VTKTRTLDVEDVGVIAAEKPVTSVNVADERLKVSVLVVLTAWRMRNAPLRRFIFAAVSTSPAVKLLGNAVGVAIVTSA